MMARMVSNSWPRDPPTSASQTAGITGVSHRTQPQFYNSNRITVNDGSYVLFYALYQVASAERESVM